MTTSLCVLGNSHIVALQQGWALSDGANTGASATWFALPGNLMAEMALRDGKLVPESERAISFMAHSSGGARDIPIRSFDAFVLAGLFVRTRAAAAIYNTHRLAAHAGRDHQIISEAAFDAALYQALRGTSAFATAHKLREVTDAAIVLTPEPLPHPNIAKDPAYKSIWAGAWMPYLHARYVAVLERLCAEHGLELVLQADSTIVPPCFTHPRYSENAARLLGANRSFAEPEHFHKNADFGAELWRLILPRLAGRRSSGTGVRGSEPAQPRDAALAGL